MARLSRRDFTTTSHILLYFEDCVYEVFLLSLRHGSASPPCFDQGLSCRIDRSIRPFRLSLFSPYHLLLDWFLHLTFLPPSHVCCPSFTHCFCYWRRTCSDQVCPSATCSCGGLTNMFRTVTSLPDAGAPSSPSLLARGRRASIPTVSSRFSCRGPAVPSSPLLTPG